MARSLSLAATKMGGEVTLVGPPTLIPPEAVAWGVGVSHDLDAVLPKLDVCYMLRVQRERQRQQFFPSVREYSRLFGLDRRRVEALPERALVMHPGPMNRGVEIASDVADLPRAVITDQVTNGIAVRMSLLYLILGGDGGRASPDRARSAAVPALGRVRLRSRDGAEPVGEEPVREPPLFRGIRVVDPASVRPRRRRRRPGRTTYRRGRRGADLDRRGRR